LNNYQAPTRFIGKLTKYLDCCESTNLIGFQEATTQDLPEGYAWIAGQQTAGKGQRGNQWLTQANQNLLVSFLLKPSHDLLPFQFFLSKAIAIGIVQGLQSWSNASFGEDLPLEIKWPNDIYLAGQKMGGILIESNFQAGKWAFSIIGIGLNINQLEFQGLRATSIRKFLKNPQRIDLSEVFNYLSTGLEKSYDSFLTQSFQAIDETYHQLLFQKNTWHLYEDQNGQFEGKIVRVDDQGLIQIEKNHGVKNYEIKELSFIFKD
jgi:BirA family biotin operon repressor/biotin-[acetyl-CoA-carboxylase] ligase